MQNVEAHSEYLGPGHSMQTMQKLTYMGFVKVETPKPQYFFVIFFMYIRGGEIQSKQYDF